MHFDIFQPYILQQAHWHTSAVSIWSADKVECPARCCVTPPSWCIHPLIFFVHQTKPTKNESIYLILTL